MTIDELVAKINDEYDLDHGFIGIARAGRLDEPALARLLTLLHECPGVGDGQIDGRLVRLLWLMPWVVEWQVQRLEGEGKPVDGLRRAGDAIFKELERIFGVP